MRLIRRSALVLILLAAAAFILDRGWRGPPLHVEPDLVLRQLDVGQGDATIIRTPGNRTIVIDAGRTGREAVAELDQLGVDTIDLLIASHNHADHIGGMPLLLHRFIVRAYLDNAVPHTTRTYQRTIAAVRSSGAQYLRASARRITLDGIIVRVFSLPPRTGDQNNNSVGVLIEHGAFRALFTGDSEHHELQHWLRADSVTSVTVLKAAHHGSWNGATPEWVAATQPRVVLVPVGRNSYGHPAPHIIEMWRRSGARIYRTDVHGSIEVRARRDGSVAIVPARSLHTAAAEAP